MKTERILFGLLATCLSFGCEKKDDNQLPGEDETIVSSGGGGGVSSRSISAAPINIRLVVATPNSISLAWDDVAVNELIYSVEYCAGMDCSEYITSPNSPLPENSVGSVETGLAVGSQYRFRVRSVNRNGSSVWLTTGNLSTLLLPNSTLTAIPAENSIALSWVPSASTHTAVEIERCSGTGCSDFRKLFNSPIAAPANSFVEYGLTAATVYRFRIRVANATTTSAWITSEDIATTNPSSGPNPPAAPTGLALTALTEASVGFTWVDNANNELIFEVERCTGSGCTSFSSAPGSPLAANSTSYNASDLAASTFYTYRIRSTGVTGSSGWLVGAEIKSAPPAPSTMIVGTVSSSAIAWSWIDNASDETSYEVERCSGASCTNFSAVSASPLTTNSVSHNETGLSGATVYRFRVRSVRTAVKSTWLTSGNITTLAAPASCSSPTTVVVDRGQKGITTTVGRGLHSDTKVIPGTRQPATAYYDGSVTGGTSQIKISYWTGSTFRVENVAGDSKVAAGSATWVRLAFLSNGRPMVFWTTGGTTVKGAMRSAAFGTTGSWESQVIDTVAGALSRALEVSVSPLDHVGLIYLTNTAATGRARFIYCAAGCTSLAGFVPMTGASDTVENTNIIAATVSTGIGWCKHNASTYYPAIVYPGNAATATRYSACLSGSLASCQVAGGWSGQTTSVVTSAGVGAKLFIDSTVVGDAPKIIGRNAANTLMQGFQMNQACNAAPAYTFAANANTFGAATTANAWHSLLRSADGAFHVLANLGTTFVHHHNSATSNFATTAWNNFGVVDGMTLPAASAGVGGADINLIDNQIYTSYGANIAPFNINLGVVADTTAASNSASAVYYRHLPDTSGGINLPNTGQTRNVSTSTTTDGKPGVAYIDNSIGVALGAQLKFAFRDSTASSKAWIYNIVPSTTQPMFPSLAFDHNNKPWISYYEASSFRYFLVTNSASDGSGDWSFYQFPINGKTANAVAPATDDTAVGMVFSGGVAKPIMIVLNSAAAGGTGVRAALFDPAVSSFTSYSLIDTLGATWGTRLSVDFSRATGLVAVAYYDIFTTRVKFNYTTNGQTWLATSPSISAIGTGREGVQIKLNPVNARPAVSYYDRAADIVYYTACNTAIDSCSSGGNWANPVSVASAIGVSGIAVTTNEQLLNTSLSFSSTGTPFVLYQTGIAAATQLLGLADNSGGSFVPTTISSSPSSAVAGAATVNFAMTGFSADSVRTSLGTFVANYVGPNNWLYATSCGD